MIKRGWMIVIFMMALILASACGRGEADHSASPLSSERESLISEKWEQVSNPFRVQGNITKIHGTENGQLVSLSLEVVKNMAVPGNAADFNFEHQTLDLFIKGAGLNAAFADKLKEGGKIAAAFAQYAIPDETPDGYVFYGALPEWIYVIQDGHYIDMQGNPVSEDRLQP